MTESRIPTEEIEVEALEVLISQQPIELYKVLKIGNLVNGGGEAKMVIAEGYVGLNGELEQRKRKKVYAGDIIEFNGQYLVVVCDEQAKPSQQQSSITAPTPPKQNQTVIATSAKTGRRSIKF
ncbi:RNA-binding S4 domain-containing protein [Agarivorans sp. QJM3NY_29]|uniref:RNA-binding S4 domain-containing protein n=1 Tax=unclassified Agarivorans TaxID=2636026 RepID=UPI003D7DC560